MRAVRLLSCYADAIAAVTMPMRYSQSYVLLDATRRFYVPHTLYMPILMMRLYAVCVTP